MITPNKTRTMLKVDYSEFVPPGHAASSLVKSSTSGILTKEHLDDSNGTFPLSRISTPHSLDIARETLCRE